MEIKSYLKNELLIKKFHLKIINLMTDFVFFKASDV